ncbi:hypothetical protein BC332_10768 [Capsicum chinense]|nr:hypothetical protein BC332_10768 [Capsicum chinense]
MPITIVEQKKCRYLVNFVNGIPRVKWTEEEVDRMNVIEGLQFAVVGKFSYGWPDFDNLRIQLPKQLNIKGDCKIGLLRNRLILMRFDRTEDFVKALDKNIVTIRTEALAATGIPNHEGPRAL